MKPTGPAVRMAAALGLAATLAAPPPAAAAAPCLPAAEADAALRARHGEAPAGMGIVGGRLLLLYAAADGATWTITISDPRNGLMCVLAAGESWEAIAPPPAGEPA